MRKMQERKEKLERPGIFLELYPLLRAKYYEALFRRDSVLNPGSGNGLFSYSAPLRKHSTLKEIDVPGLLLSL